MRTRLMTNCRALLALPVFLLLASTLKAQVDTIPSGPWNWGGTGTINFSQVSLNNWAAGGQNTIALLGIGNIYANYKKGHNTWNNSLDITYGALKQGKSRIAKSDDRLDLQGKYGHNLSIDWYYSGLLNFRSQLTPTYNKNGDTLISSFLSPAFIVASIGLDYKPNENFSIFISPFTGKFTFVRDEALADSGYFGMKPARRNADGSIIPGTGERLREELGAYLNLRYRKEIMQNIVLQTKLDLFSNYLHNPQNIDVNWETLLDLKVNKFVSVSVFTHLIYDDDILIKLDKDGDGITDGEGRRIQFKETLGVGLTYKF